MHHELIGAVDYVADTLAEVAARAIEVNVRIIELEVAEEDPVQRVVVVLARVREERVEVPTTFLDDLREADDLRAGAHDDEELQPAILDKVILLNHFSWSLCFQLNCLSHLCQTQLSYRQIQLAKIEARTLQQNMYTVPHSEKPWPQ